MTASSTPDSSTEIATLRIELEYSDPLIWRAIEIPTSITLDAVHDIVQAAMGWQDSHLWEFVVDRQSYGPPMEDAWGETRGKAASAVRLRDLLSPGKTRISYTYDFGDSWEHRLIVSDVRPGDSGTAYPRFVGGERNGPPEDCGGIPGFYDMLDARADPKHPDHADIGEWLGDYDPDELAVASIEAALGRIAALPKAAARRTGKSSSR